MENLFSIYRMMLAESAELHKKEGNIQLERLFRNTQGRLRDLLNRLRNREPVIAFVGLTNVGKSTLLSALFGAKVAPARNRPWSSVPVEYQYSEKYEINAEFTDTIDTAAATFDSVDQILEAIERYATAQGDASTRILYAKMPSELLRDGLIIADTPGFGAAAVAGGDNHGTNLLEYLPRADYIFWVIKSLQGITKVELDFYNNFLMDRCRDIVVNCYDEYSAEERKEFIRVNEAPLFNRFRWHFIDARGALRAKINNDNSLLTVSGMGDFESKILSLSPTEKRVEYLNGALIKFFDDIRRFKSARSERMFFAEHRRLQLVHEIEKCAENSAVFNAMRASVL